MPDYVISVDLQKHINAIKLADLDDGGKATADYKVGQLNALPGNVDRDEFRRLDAAGIINKDMSADKIKQTLKGYYNPPSDPEPEPDPEDTEPEQIPCLTLPIIQIFYNIVRPIIEDFCTVTDPEPETACDIFKEFFNGTGYSIKWIEDPEDDEITGAELRDKDGELIFTTDQDI